MGRFFSSPRTILSILTALFFPIVQDLNIYGDLGEKKLSFSLYLFGFIRLVGGYVTSYQGGVALHVSEKKAILLPYTGMDEKRKKFSFVRSFRLLSLKCTTETGAQYFAGAACVSALLKTFLAIKKQYKKSDVNLWLTDGDVLRTSVQIVTYFSLFILGVLSAKFAVKYIIGRIRKWKEKEKSTVS